MILGAPFDSGTSYRSGARFGPMAIRSTDYLPHDGSRPHLALGVDPLQDMRVLDAGDVEMPPTETELSLKRLEDAVHAVCAAGAIPVILGGDHTIAWPDIAGVARHLGQGRVSVVHFDAHADTGEDRVGLAVGHGTPMRRLIESGAVRGDRFIQVGLRGYWPPPETLAWMAEQGMRSYEMTEVVERGLDACLDEAEALAVDDCDGVFLSIDIDVVDPGHGTRHRHPRAGRHDRPPAARRGPPAGPTAADRRHGRRRGRATLRPRGRHRHARQPGRSRGPVGHRRPPTRGVSSPISG